MSILDDGSPTQAGGDYLIGQDLAALSVDELEEKIVKLKAEIERLETEITAKQSTLNTADSFFNS